MTAKPIHRLWETYWTQNKSVSIRNRIVEHYYLLVPRLVAEARRRLPPNTDLDVVASAAGEALIEAVERFDPFDCPTFPAFARIVIRSRIADALKAELAARGEAENLGDAVSLEETVRPKPLGRRSNGVELEDLVRWRHERAEAREEARRTDRKDLRGLAAHIEAYERLPTRTKTILYLRFAEEMPEREIAAFLGISQPRVSQLIHEALGRLMG